MRWQPLAWQQTAWERLLAAEKSGHLPHAWLLAGPMNIGKRHFAQGMAELLLKESAHLLAGGHPDLIRLSPEEGKSQIGVDALRDAMQRLALTSHSSGKRILQIEPVDALNDSGVNSLLKTLEEPPGAAHLILITSRLTSLKSTVRSRCQILRPGLPTSKQKLDWSGPEHDAADLENWSEWLTGLARALNGVGSLDRTQTVPFLRWLLREGTRALASQLSQSAQSQTIFSRLTPHALSDWLMQAWHAHRALAGQSAVNPRLLLESLMIGLYERASAKP